MGLCNMKDDMTRAGHSTFTKSRLKLNGVKRVKCDLIIVLAVLCDRQMLCHIFMLHKFICINVRWEIACISGQNGLAVLLGFADVCDTSHRYK